MVNTTDIKNVDYIVVGAGSAGCVVASRLSEDSDTSVLLIEAGRKDHLGLTKIPLALQYTIGNPRYDWCYQSEPDYSRNGARELWPRGRMLGGSSGINGMVFLRGSAADYDAWEKLGNTGWGWNSMLPYFKRIETSDREDSELRGKSGPLSIRSLRWRHPVSRRFIEAAIAADIPYSADLNGELHDGVGWTDGTIINGRRHSSYDAYIAPNLHRKNLTVKSGVTVKKILIKEGIARGVVLSDNNDEYIINANKGVVLCAGAINSPQLLMLSGIGPAKDLVEAGVQPIVDNPQVGQNLMEHPGIYIQAEVKTPTLNRYSSPWQMSLQALRWFFSNTSPFGNQVAQATAFCRTEPILSDPDIQILLFVYGSSLVNGKRVIPKRNLVSFLLNVNYPASRGFLKLRSADPYDSIAIHPQLLANEEDVRTLVQGLESVRKICSQSPFTEDLAGFLDLPPANAEYAVKEAYIRNKTKPFLHPAGTCRMGNDDKSIVTPDLRVRNVDRLWVADSSVFPRMVAANINATTMAVGEKAADMIKSV